MIDTAAMNLMNTLREHLGEVKVYAKRLRELGYQVTLEGPLRDGTYTYNAALVPEDMIENVTAAATKRIAL